MCTFIVYRYFLNLEDTRCLNFQTEFLTKGFQRFLLSWCLFLVFLHLPLLVHFTPQRISQFLLEWTTLFLSLLRQCCGVQPCTYANSTLYSMRYWLVPLVTGLFLGCSACYCLVPWFFRLLLACSLLVSLVTGLFHVLQRRCQSTLLLL